MYHPIRVLEKNLIEALAQRDAIIKTFFPKTPTNEMAKIDIVIMELRKAIVLLKQEKKFYMSVQEMEEKFAKKPKLALTEYYKIPRDYADLIVGFE